MCGRFTLTSPASKLVEFFSTLKPEFEIEPRYNIAPTQMTPAILNDGGVRILRMMRWGLVPSWAKDISDGARMINARAETVASKPAFRKAFEKRRCLIPADGFFEWKRSGKEKQPYLIRMRDEAPFAFAGVWERWDDSEGGAVESYFRCNDNTERTHVDYPRSDAGDSSRRASGRLVATVLAGR